MAVTGGLSFKTVIAAAPHVRGDHEWRPLLLGRQRARSSRQWYEHGTGTVRDVAGVEVEWEPSVIPCSRVPVRSPAGALDLADCRRNGLYACGLTSAGAAYCWGH